MADREMMRDPCISSHQRGKGYMHRILGKSNRGVGGWKLGGQRQLTSAAHIDVTHGPAHKLSRLVSHVEAQCFLFFSKHPVYAH